MTTSWWEQERPVRFWRRTCREQRGTAAEMFRRMYWDTALSASDPVLRMLRDVVGIDQVCLVLISRTCAETWL
jgi:hypothetical protein